jgi:hypothetical protein
MVSNIDAVRQRTRPTTPRSTKDTRSCEPPHEVGRDRPLRGLDDAAGRLSASGTTARTMATAVGRSAIWTVTTLMTCSAVCAHDADVPARCDLPGCHGELGRIGKVAVIPGHGHGDVIPVGCFVHARHHKSGARHFRAGELVRGGQL